MLTELTYTTATAISVNKFLALPPELRVLAYRFLLVDNPPLELSNHGLYDRLSSCRFSEMGPRDDLTLSTVPEYLQFVIEARYEYWTQNTFKIDLGIGNVESVRSLCEPLRHVRHLQILDAYYCQDYLQPEAKTRNLQATTNSICTCLILILEHAIGLKTLHFRAGFGTIAHSVVPAYPIWSALRTIKGRLEGLEIVLLWFTGYRGRIEPILEHCIALRQEILCNPSRVRQNPIWVSCDDTRRSQLYSYVFFHDRSNGDTLLDTKSDRIRELLIAEMWAILSFAVEEDTGHTIHEPTLICEVNDVGAFVKDGKVLP